MICYFIKLYQINFLVSIEFHIYSNDKLESLFAFEY